MKNPPNQKHRFQILENDLKTEHERAGDTNPIHFDYDYAIKRGFTRPISFGSILVSHINSFVGHIYPGHGSVIIQSDISFIKPVFPGHHYTVELIESSFSPSINVYQLKLQVLDSGSNSVCSAKYKVKGDLIDR